MILITMTETDGSFWARHDYAVPDNIALPLIEAGKATLSARHAESGLPPDAGYTTRIMRPRPAAPPAPPKKKARR